MRKRSARLDQLVKIAEADERKLAEATGAGQRKLSDHKARLGELNAYRHEYARNAKTRGYSSAAQLKDFQEFMSKLDQAVQSQQQIIQECERSLEVCRQHWQVKRQRVESLAKVRERYSAEEMLRLEREMQREMDDRTSTFPLFPDAAE